MLETTLNFGICLDLFELAHLWHELWPSNGRLSHHRLHETGSAAVWPIPTKRRLQMINTLIFFSENIAQQNAQDAKVQRIRRFW